MVIMLTKWTKQITQNDKGTSLLAAVALSFELGAVTSANSQPVVPFARVGAVEAGWSAESPKCQVYQNKRIWVSWKRNTSICV